MTVTADGLLSLAAHELSGSTDRLIADVIAALRSGVPELWADPDLARMSVLNVTEHLEAALAAVEKGRPDLMEPPVADVERARRLARNGLPVTVMLRAHRLAQGIALDRLFAVLPRLTSDPELLVAATRRMIAVSTGYVDHASEQGVAAFEEERDRRLQWRLSAVNAAGMRIGTTLDISRTAQELTDFATERFADRATVDLLDIALSRREPPGDGPYELRRIAQRSVSGDDSEPAGAPEEHQVCPDQSSPLFQALLTGDPSRHHSAVGQTHSTLVVPLRARDTTLGVAQFSRHRNPEPYRDEDLLLAQEVTARAAVAVDNARRYTHARTAALSLQRSLLPARTPPLSAVEVACRYLPTGNQLGVGGDWYDVIPLSGARVALVVGDVVGHGLRAASTMGRLRTAVRTLADIDLPPDELLTHLDDVVLRLSTEHSTAADPDSADVGATCLYAVYDPVSRCCTLARAGHVPPCVVTDGGAVDVLELPAGPPLGLGGLPFESAEVDLPEGSVLALYTDGLLDNDGQHDIDAGLVRLRQALAEPAPSLEAGCDTVLGILLPDRPRDDVALLLARTRAFGDRQVADWDLAVDPAMVSRLRSEVCEQLGSWGLEDLGFTAELVVSELVTNAIRYGRPPMRLRLIHDGSLLCEVSDASGTTPHQRRARTYDEGGRGLLLVAQLAEHWGTRHARHGKTVWAELSEDAGFPGLTSA